MREFNKIPLKSSLGWAGHLICDAILSSERGECYIYMTYFCSNDARWYSQISRPHHVDALGSTLSYIPNFHSATHWTTYTSQKLFSDLSIFTNLSWRPKESAHESCFSHQNTYTIRILNASCIWSQDPDSYLVRGSQFFKDLGNRITN